MRAGNSGSGWQVIGASVPGESHRRSGVPCQDAHLWREMGRGVLIAAVADGAGSAACAELGSALAARAAVEEASARLGTALPCDEATRRVLLQNVFQAARHALVVQAAELEISSLNFATTLLVAVVTPDWVAAGQIGDGAVVVRSPDNSFKALTRARGREYINETTFLTSTSYFENVQFIVQEGPVNGLALFSDGLQMLALKMPQGLPHVAFFAPLLRILADSPQRDRAEAQLHRFLQSSHVSQRADDDLTLVLAVRDDLC